MATENAQLVLKWPKLWWLIK